MLLLTACSPCSLRYLFLERFEQTKKVPLLLFSHLVQRGQLSKGQRDNGDCLFRMLWSEVTNRQTWDGGREDGHVQTGFLHTWDGCLYQMRWSLGVTYWSAHRLTLSITSNQRSCMDSSWRKVELQSSCGWRNLSWHVRWAEKMAHMLLLAFAWRSCTTKRWREWKLKPLVLHKRQDTAPILVTDVLGSVFDQLMTVQSA